MTRPISRFKRSGKRLAKASYARLSITQAHTAMHLFPIAAAAVMTTATTKLYLADVYKHLMGHREALLKGLLVGRRKPFDMLEHRGDNSVAVISSDLVLDKYASLCCKYPIIHKFAVQALTCNAVLNALAKVLDIFRGVVEYKSAADLLEAIIGKIDQILGEARARAFVTDLLGPLVTSAVMACYAELNARSAHRRSPITPRLSPTTTSFTLAFNRHPAEDTIDHHLHLLSEPPRQSTKSSNTPLVELDQYTAASSSAQGHAGVTLYPHSRGAKRGRDEEEADADADLNEIMDETEYMPSSNVAKQTQPHRKKRKVEASSSNKENEPICNVPGVDAAAQTPGKPLASRDPVCRAFQALPAGSIAFDLAYPSDSIYPASIDESVGENLVHYVLMASLTDVWADEEMSSHAAKEAVTAMMSPDTVQYIADALGIRCTFFQAVARASLEHPHGVIRDAIQAIYAHVFPVAIELVRPLYDHFQSESLERTRKHLTDVWRLREAGYIHRPNVEPIHAVLATNCYTIEHILDRRFLRFLGLI
ncbi:hypothetical protein EV714DRAFT_268393 [Schizophyllum commune]